MARTYSKVGLLSIAMLLLATLCTCDITQDSRECANQLVWFVATCLTYVGGEVKAPTQDCCNSIKQVLKTSTKCLCFPVKDRNDPSVGLKINATLALSLPQMCNLPASLSDCPALLHMAPSSVDTKIYDDFAKALPANVYAPTSSDNPIVGGGGISIKETSDTSAKSKRQLVNLMFYGLWLGFFYFT